MRLRTIKGAIKEIRTMDPASAISEYWLRGMVRDGSIPCIKSGNKHLLDLDLVTSLMNSYFQGEK